jgi:hypothetical protein
LRRRRNGKKTTNSNRRIHPIFRPPPTLAAVVAHLVGLEQKGVKALGTEAFQVVERTVAQGEAGVFEGGVELAEERSGGKHIYLS